MPKRVPVTMYCSVVKGTDEMNRANLKIAVFCEKPVFFTTIDVRSGYIGENKTGRYFIESTNGMFRIIEKMEKSRCVRGAAV